MAQFETVDDLLRAAPSLLKSGVDLEHHLQLPGMLSPKLRAALDRTLGAPRIRLTPAARARAIQALRKHPIRVRHGSETLARIALPEGEFDVKVAFRIPLLNDVLAGAYATQVIPRAIAGSTFSPILDVATLQPLTTGIPAGTTTGQLHITAPPTIAAASGVDAPIASLPFRLDFVREVATPLPGRPRRTVVAATLTGTFHIALTLAASVDTTTGRVSLIFDTTTPPAAGVADIDVASDSQVQPSTPDALHDHIRGNDTRLRLGFTLALNGVGVSPPFAVPGLDGASLFVQQAAIRARTSDGGVVVVGVIVGADPSPPAHAGDLAHLALPFQLSDSNVIVRAQSSFADKVLRAARDSGELQRAVNQAVDDFQRGLSASITSTYAEIDTNVIKLRVGLFITGFCFQPVDVTYAIDLTFSVIDGQIVVTRHDEVQDKGLDIFFCILTGLIFAIPTLGLSLIVPLVRLGYIVADDSGDPAPFTVSAMFESPVPVPGTELLPRVEVLQAAAIDHELRSNGRLTLARDNLNTYVYAVFHDVSDLGEQTAIAGATVELMDLDRPAPPSDDAVPSSSVSESDGVRITRTLLHYEPGTTNQRLATSKTRDDGRVRFVLTPRELTTTAGFADFDVKRTNLASGASFTTHERHTPVVERRPDLFFKLTRASGSTASTQGGSINNVGPGHVGTADQPLEFHFGGPIVARG